MISEKPSNKDLSQLSQLLAAHGKPTTARAKKTTKAITPANDNKPAREQLAWPALERLAYRGDYRRLFALRHWKNMVFPGSEIEAPEENNLDPETTIEVRPSEAELLAAVGWKVVGRERWHFTGEIVNTYEQKVCTPSHHRNKNNGIDTQLGDLLFRDGVLIEWGKTRKGRALRPVERPRGAKGGSNAARSDSAIWSYLKLRGAVASPLTAKPYSKPLSGEPALVPMLDSQKGTEEARELLQSLGVDGSVPFDLLPRPAIRCPDGLVSGPQWAGGVKRPKPTGEISAAAGREPDFARQVEVLDYVDHLRHHLGRHALVLDMAITDATAKEIGVAMGQAPAYAEKRGPSLIDAAIDALIDLDETARVKFAPAEEKIAA
ncbi:hypothetical protein KGO5_04234 [Sinorhizobium sp. KGO-5]|uniref:hypothetical protein n=1 Tax=Sinorhizobium sp. KGO-5 TaxID=1470810 RepID=UPI0029492AAA|nr:hypothetical protein KGO5_04234 [Sinorhizobium sp. KGO-5]